MKYAAITLLSLVCLGCFSVPTMEDDKSIVAGIKCVTEEENIHLLYLYQRALSQDADYQLNMHWAFRLALAEQNGKFKPLPGFALDEELSQAPQVPLLPGREGFYAEQYYERAKEYKRMGEQEKLKLRGYQDMLYGKYGVDPERGFVFGSNGRACVAPPNRK